MADTATRQGGTFAPLRHVLFRRVWTSSVLSNFGQLIQNVGAAWAMTRLTGRADMVALVQTATFAPIVLLSLPAGAIADSYDRRKVALVALGIMLGGAAGLTLVTLFDMLTPALLLLFCTMVGTGMALFTPAWQASVGEQVPKEILPQAIALNSISYNVARSFGPAVGGLLVAVAGVVSAFLLNAIAYLPMLATMYFWRRKPEKHRLPPEALGRAIISGIRFIMHSPPIRTIWLRILIAGMVGSAPMALMPLVARDLLGGGAALFGILLGFYGMGAILGAVLIGPIRERLSNEGMMAVAMTVIGSSMVGIALSGSAVLTCALLVIVGACWMIVMALGTIGIQLSSPRWVTGRALAGFTTAACAGVAFGSIGWGHVAEDHGTAVAMAASGIGLFFVIPLGLIFRMPEVEVQGEHGLQLGDPDVALDITGRSGPISLTIEYRVDPANARDFHNAMLAMEPIRHRTGGYAWSLARDIGDPELWIERYHTPTWNDYLRQRERLTAADMAAWEHALAFHIGEKPQVRRRLERPFGSVRWSDDVPDHGLRIAVPQPN
ncbi:MAG: MFS transporter [Pseudomonadota bacterium]